MCRNKQENQADHFTTGIQQILPFTFRAQASYPAMSNPRAACGPVEGFVQPSLVFAVVKVSYILTSC